MLDLDEGYVAPLRGRSSIVRKARRIDVECVVRGRLAGSGWTEYLARQTLGGEPLPSGMRRGDELPELQFTPAAKNDIGHDQNMTRSNLNDLVGVELASDLERASMNLFIRAHRMAAVAGFVLADTKFEFGHVDGMLTLIDEALTPDSSRYWDFATWAPGTEPPGFDKQVVRDWLESSGWNKEAPGPELPAHIVDTTRQRYTEVLDRLVSSQETGEKR
jgi:phosphoribosylaminoimidazole-succinocarboxamide synthase